MKFSQIILENRVDDFKGKYQQKFNEDQLNRIIDNVPQKFLDWAGKNLDSINFDEGLQGVSKNLREFEKISSNLPKTDINTYGSTKELFDALNAYANRPKRQYQKVDGGNVVYDDGKFFVVNPQTHQSSCYYGRGTKWCTVADSDHQFNKYNEDGKLFYILDRTKDSNDPLYKVALLKKFEGEEIFYNSKDEQTKILRAVWGEDVYDRIMEYVNTYLEQEYSEQIKIFSDKIRAKKEKERLEALRYQRIQRQKEEQAEERRMEGEWTLGPDCPDEGLKAHALFDWLIEQLDIDARTAEDEINLIELRTNLEQLQVRLGELENSDEDTSEIEDEIEVIEEEISEIESKVDVYNINPDGRYYNMTEFEVLGAGIDDRRYAVGTEDEVKTSCYEYVEQLIDDIGYEGFSRNFAMSYLDTDAIVSQAEDDYRYDVTENPEVYLDESDRELSSSQVETISILKMRIEKAEAQIEEFEDRLGEDDDEYYERKIEELKTAIEEFEDEILDIEADPQGDFPEHLIEEKVDDLLDDVRSDPESYLSDRGLDWADYIDKDEFIEAVIDADGYGHTLNRYDGNADEISVQDNWFYVMRID